MSVVMVDDTVGDPKLITGPVPCFTPRRQWSIPASTPLVVSRGQCIDLSQVSSCTSTPVTGNENVASPTVERFQHGVVRTLKLD